MNRTLSLTTASAALVLFATSLLAPMQASAAERQISVQPKPGKLQTFTVESGADQKPVEVAETAPEAPKKIKPKAFRVEEDNDQVVIEPKQPPKKNQFRFRVEEEAEQAAAEPKLTPKKPKLTPKQPKIQEFRVDEESGEVADTPIEAEEEDIASSQEVRPAGTPNKKKTPALTDEEQAASEEDKEEAIAADQPETEASADEEEAVAETEAEDDGEPTIIRKMKPGKKYKRYVVKYKSYHQSQDDYGYQQQGYDGPSCNNNYNY